MATTLTAAAPGSVAGRAAAALGLILVGLLTAAWIGQQLEVQLGAGRVVRYGIQALIMSGIVVPGIWWLRTRRDGLSLEGVGLVRRGRVLRGFGLGLAILGVPLVITLAFTEVFGWASIRYEHSASGLLAVLAGLATVFLFEALPEELVFRGYIYRTLSGVQARWRAALLTVGLFVVMPVLMFPVQRYVLGIEGTIGGASTITPQYVITMALFGSFVQYLRVLSGTIWMGIGFHFTFVSLNRLVGPRPANAIQFTDIINGGPLQMVTMVSVAFALLLVLAYPKISGRALGWAKSDPE
jgi:hypothetical protein